MPAHPGAGGPDTASALTVASVLRFGLPEYARHHRLPAHHWSVINAIVACRTAARGGERYECQLCHRDHVVYHSCRNRHCPTCQGANSADWLERQEKVLLPVSYFHTVFTLPHCLNGLMAQNQAALYQLLFKTASATLLEFGKNNLGVQLGFTAVLHTWSQTLLDHYHLHCIVAGGGLSLDGQRWISCSHKFLFHVQALSIVFRAKFIDGLRALYGQGELQCAGTLKALAAPLAFAGLIKEAMAESWVVYAKRPFAGPKQVLAYLSLYTHRVGMSNRRLISLNQSEGTVCFSWKDYAHGQRRKQMTLAVAEFIRRLRLHILPPRFVKIRHYGFLSNGNRDRKTQRARELLNVPKAEAAPPAQTVATGIEPAAWRCPHCRQPTRYVVQPIPPQWTKAPVVADTS